MSPRTLLTLTLLAALPACAQPADIAPPTAFKVEAPKLEKTDLSTPTLAVKSFVVALNKFDFEEAARCVDGGKPGEVKNLDIMTGQWKAADGRIFIGEAKERILGDRALVTLLAQMKMKAGPDGAPPNEPPQTERVRLKLSDGLWKLAGNSDLPFPGAAPQPNPAEPPGLEHGTGFITIAAGILTTPNLLVKAQANAVRAMCQHNLKQLAQGALQLRQEFDGQFAWEKAVLKARISAERATLLSEKWQQAVYPHAKNLMTYFCPLREENGGETQARRDKITDNLGMRRTGEPYSCNLHLDGLAAEDIKSPALTVLFYEGKGGKLDFRHDGKANVAFCDGHVEAIEEADVNKLIWNPKDKGKQP